MPLFLGTSSSRMQILKKSEQNHCFFKFKKKYMENSCSDKQPLAACSHLQPLAATSSHLQPLAATCSHLQPLAATCSHSQPLPATCSHLPRQPFAATCSHSQPLPATCSHLPRQPFAATCSHEQVAASGCIFENQIAPPAPTMKQPVKFKPPCRPCEMALKMIRLI